MKNLYKLIGIIALVAVIGFSFAACDDGSKDDKDGGGGTFTLTNIPSEYNGKYFYVNVNKNGSVVNGDAAWGTMYDSGLIGDLVPISNGRASIPLWTGAADGVGFQRYTRTGTFDCEAFIHSSNNPYGGGLVYMDLYNVSFTNGSATKSWNDGTIR
jgi:hypothetical protein